MPQIQKTCLKLLYRMCGRHAFLPKAMKIHAWYDQTRDALYRGGYADVWKGDHCGRDVAVKVLRKYSNSDPKKIIGVGCWLCSLSASRCADNPVQRFCKEVVTWKTLRHPNVLPLIGVTMTETRFAMISEWMASGNINKFVEAHPHVDRLELVGSPPKVSLSSFH